MGGERGREGFGGVGKAEGEQAKGRSEQLESASSGPNGWMFWPDAHGMGADEVEWRPFMARYEHVYERVGGLNGGLGDIFEEVSEGSFGVSRCFNCGDPEHTVRSCLEPPNHALIALSRALFQFLHQSNGDETERFHVAEDWKLQRLRWVEDFEPGVIRNKALKEALDLHEGGEAPWLYNMLEWGYPPGWASQEDPRELMFKRIVFGEITEADDDELGEFSIFGEAGDKEVLNLRPASATRELNPNPISRASNSEDCTNPSAHLAGNTNTPMSTTSPAVRRWATYQTSLFSSDLLPVYNRRSLPPLDGDVPAGAATSHPENMGKDDFGSNMSIEHPWRRPDAFSAFGPVGWAKAYEKVLTRRAQVEQDYQKVFSVYPASRSLMPEVGTADGTAISSSLSPGNNTEDDMDLSD